ncbi:50S ribosomal protein L29 [Candidatus Azambacteria bacterium]|nr:50S ribosomal protein L29 [Candidatus Azambacteria bacterium]
MKKAELKSKSQEELSKVLVEDAAKLKDLKFDLSFNRLKNFSEIKKVKREIARVKTLLNQK